MGCAILAGMKARASGVFVGRIRELGELERVLDAARAGSGATALVAGGAGIGKTGVASRARDAGFVVLTGHSIDLRGDAGAAHRARRIRASEWRATRLCPLAEAMANCGQAAGIAGHRERFRRMRIATSSRWARLTRWPVAAAAAAVMLAPAQALASGGAGAPGCQLQRPDRSAAGDLLGIARDTWKFYSADVDPPLTCRWTTSRSRAALPAPTGVRPVHLGRQHRRVPVGGGRGRRPRPDQQAAGGRPGRGHADRGCSS